MAKDPVAARQYFETAANLGDTDAMNEAAWCYLEGFGGKKDKVRQVTPTGIGEASVPRVLVLDINHTRTVSSWQPNTTDSLNLKETK